MCGRCGKMSAADQQQHDSAARYAFSATSLPDSARVRTNRSAPYPSPTTQGSNTRPPYIRPVRSPTVNHITGAGSIQPQSVDSQRPNPPTVNHNSGSLRPPSVASQRPIPPTVNHSTGSIRPPSVNSQRPTHDGVNNMHLNSEGRNTVQMCHQILEEMRHGLDEQRQIKADLRKIGTIVGKLEDNVRFLSDELKHHTDQSFAIENSSFKV